MNKPKSPCVQDCPDRDQWCHCRCEKTLPMSGILRNGGRKTHKENSLSKIILPMHGKILQGSGDICEKGTLVVEFER